MKNTRHRFFLALYGVLALSSFAAAGAPVVTPATVDLQGNCAQVQLVVQQPPESGIVALDSPDLTRTVTYTSSQPEIATVNAAGRVRQWRTAPPRS